METVQDGITRRSLLKGAVLAGVGAAALGTIPATQALADEAEESEEAEETAEGEETAESEETATSADPNAVPDSWDLETEVVVVGYGYAAMASAISAAVEGSQVQVFEKAPEEEAGGNSSVCCGYFNLVAGDGAFDYWKALADGGVSDEECQAVADATELMPQWLQDNVFPDCEITEYSGDDAVKTFNNVDYPDAGCLGISIPLEGPGTDENMGLGNAMWLEMDEVIKEQYSDNITVNFESEVTHLIFDPETKEVYGVRVQQGDSEICVKASKGVVMACGGYENNYDMIKDFYMPYYEQYHIGSPYNTGDGIKMLMEIGAKLRHMSAVEYGATCDLALSEEYHQAICTHNGGDNTHMVYIGNHGERFIAENSRWPAHDKRYPYPCFNQSSPDYETVNYPWWMVFDETRRNLGTIFAWSNPDRNEGWAAVRDVYQWSDDCTPEIEAGYVLQADTLEELGGLMGFEGDDLETFLETMEAFNENGANLEDPVFGREPTNDEYDLGMTVSDAPFYAIQCGICYLNTNGGGARSVDYQIVDWNDNPIPRLYEAGELGSIFYHYYSGGGNICEAFTSGMMCGQNVSALAAWDDPEAVAAAEEEAAEAAEEEAEETAEAEETTEDTTEAEATTEDSAETEVAEDALEGTGNGIGGAFTVYVTVDDNGCITSVTVGENSETQGIGSVAIEELPELFIGMSTAEEIDSVDGITGATVTSDAIKTAIKNALGL